MWTNARQLTNLQQDSHPRWVETMTPLLTTLCDFLWLLLGEVRLQFPLGKDRLCFSNLHVQCTKVKWVNFILFLLLIFLILYYIFPVQMVVLDGNFAVGCGSAWNGLQLNTYISMYATTNRCYNVRSLWAWNGLPLNTYISMYARTDRCYTERRLWAWNELPLNTYILMYARTNRCYNERGSRLIYVRSSIPHCSPRISNSLGRN